MNEIQVFMIGFSLGGVIVALINIAMLRSWK